MISIGRGFATQRIFCKHGLRRLGSFVATNSRTLLFGFRSGVAADAGLPPSTTRRPTRKDEIAANARLARLAGEIGGALRETSRSLSDPASLTQDGTHALKAGQNCECPDISPRLVTRATAALRASIGAHAVDGLRDPADRPVCRSSHGIRPADPLRFLAPR